MKEQVAVDRAGGRMRRARAGGQEEGVDRGQFGFEQRTQHRYTAGVRPGGGSGSLRRG
ncbi:hypothetical protein [Microtetraspora malaysiensis]|uniref:Uncharacterized protein n=1 Tax=Microtetraspora malaysiensis TaxID=161358 RepID=A0ABW6SJP5_9ACTN